MNGPRADSRRFAWWPVAAAAGLLATSEWLAVTRVGYLAIAAIATGVAVAGLRGLGRRERWWAYVSTAGLILGVALAGYTQWQLYRIDHRWPEIRSGLGTDAMAALNGRVDQALSAMRNEAAKALAVPEDTVAAFAALSGLAPGPEDAGVVVYQDGLPFAWAGRIHVRTDTLTDSVGVARSAFYTAIYRADSAGRRRVVFTRLLDAAPPADRLAVAIASQIARIFSLPGFEFSATAARASGEEWHAVWDHTKILTYARPAPITQGVVRLKTLQGAQLVIAILLAVSLMCFVIGAWRVGRRFRWRLATIAVALGCTAFAPLGAFSNYSRLFNAAFYTTDVGGALTANAGALLITGVLTMLALLAGVRRLARRRPRAWWALGVLLVAGLGPFLLRDLARGISIPIYGVDPSLWLIWEVPIFLAGCAVLLAGAGAAAGSAALGEDRGMPPWAGPVLGAAAALLAPIAWRANGGWPWWYPIPWIVAIGALALSRRSRAVVLSAATVAALGATTLVWGATTRGRVALAEQDVRGLSQNDANVVLLVERFAASVRAGGMPEVSRRWLLRAYANSSLPPAGFPVWLSIWTGSDEPAAALPTTSMRVPMGQVRAIVEQARLADTTVMYPIIAQPAVQLGVGIPTPAGVVVVVAAPRTRLIAADPFAKLLGIDQPPEAEPPYVLQLAEAPEYVPAGPPRVDWRREGTALHGDWFTKSGLGASRVHIEVELLSVSALVQRGSLIVLLDVAIVWLVWFVSVLADGAVGRWLRERQRRWRRSYRTRLTLALFTFFIVPAMAFAAWSYQQLAADAAQSRELLVGETLRAVAPVAGDPGWMARESARLEAPLYLYRDGELVEASDSLLAALVPTGRFLPPDKQVSLVVHDEVSQSAELTFGASQALFGFRAVDDPAGAVLVAPARADNLPLERRRRDLGILVMFATAAGALAAFWLSGLVARGLGDPIRSLRQAALTLAAGGRSPALEDNPTVEFRPVFAAFRRMATDLEASRTATAHAERVLAWGEMARQVAHEIKNPLTPIRLGVQHLLRARADPRVDFDQVLDENVKRILGEIDHLDEIARAFSRYGAAPNARSAAEPVDVAVTVRDLIGLERMGDEGIQWALESVDGVSMAMAQRDELREVLLNVYDNARLAGATMIATALTCADGVVIEVRDDGHGIPADLLSRIFEPHFSTRSSGSGLGLAISRQLIEGWGGTIDVVSEEGKGSVVRIHLRTA